MGVQVVAMWTQLRSNGWHACPCGHLISDWKFRQTTRVLSIELRLFQSTPASYRRFQTPTPIETFQASYSIDMTNETRGMQLSGDVLSAEWIIGDRGKGQSSCYVPHSTRVGRGAHCPLRPWAVSMESTTGN